MRQPRTAVPVDEGRFAFGRNWDRFLRVVDENRIKGAEASLVDLLGDISGLSFLDIGSGSGIASLAAMRLGASRVHAFDYDATAVLCTREMKRRYAPAATEWTIEQGDVMDREYMNRLERFDIVYSWGVLYHTGDVWSATENASYAVEPGGRLALALARDQGMTSRFWGSVKKTYNRNALGKALVVGVFVPAFFVNGLITDALRRRDPRARYRDYWSQRGMSRVHDWLDWLGGYPFEVVSDRDLTEFLAARGFSLERFVEGQGSMRLHEYVFRASDARRSS
jgi:SAM-dependent methyltransferase